MPSPSLRASRIARVAALGLSLNIPAGAPPAQPASTEAELRRLIQANLDAIAPGQVEVWRRNTHERLIHVDENG